VKSIRLSLMVYFLGLLAVALGMASLLVYRIAEQTLEAKKCATEDLIRTQFQKRQEQERDNFDKALLAQAQSLARLVQVQSDFSRLDYLSVRALGLLSSQISPNGYVLAPVWVGEGVPPSTGRREHSPLFFHFHQDSSKFSRDVKLKDELLLPNDGQVCEYYQVDSPAGRSYYSRSMNGIPFPLDPKAFAPDRLVSWRFDDTTRDATTPVRRVVLKASGVELVSVSGRRHPPRSGPTIYVHCAAATLNRDAVLVKLGEQRDEDLAAVATQTKGSLRELRFWLFGISLAVFIATGIGGFWLVRRGLSPLCRLSDAVSRVSTKDFRLHLGERPLPLELRPIAERLTVTLDLLKRAFAREKQAAADISHELRTPLAALLTTAEFALRKPRSPEQYRELLSDCHTSAQQMNQIVERLLTLARLDAGVDRLRVQSVDVATLARECAAMIRPLAEARGLRLNVKTPPSASAITLNGISGDGTCLLQADPDKLREIVSNLLHNAIQYNRPGGSVDLRVGRENGTLEVEVEDTGIGIAPEVREHIFERFYRADPSRGGDDLHAGLGLAIVKEYIDLMGGSIDVDSREGQGSTFRVVLPVH
jgi:heavy metal sensor kinase